jgi:ferric-dicitrate binding protein FerR (iron transport regulator)
MSDPTTGEERDLLLEAALRASGRRPQPSAAGTARAYAQAQQEWQRVVSSSLRRQRARRAGWAAGLLAASIAGAAIIFGVHRTVQAPERLAIVLRIQGNASVTAPGSTMTALLDAASVAAGSTLETAPDGRVALQLTGGESLRLDRGTRLAVIDATSMRLERGRIYVDSGSHAGRRSIRIRTPLALLTDVGTQFQTEWREGVLRLRVREGTVSVGESGLAPKAGTIVAGQVMSLHQDRTRSLERADGFGPAWAWIADIAPGPGGDEHRLEPILQWICRELGCRLHYADARTRELVSAVMLDGSLEGLSPEQAFEVVQRITKFRYRMEAGELNVGRADERP